MAIAFSLFEDRREPYENIERALAITIKPGPDANEAIQRLRRIRWHFPMLVVYREQSENRWSYVTLGLSSPELGEGD